MLTQDPTLYTTRSPFALRVVLPIDGHAAETPALIPFGQPVNRRISDAHIGRARIQHHDQAARSQSAETRPVARQRPAEAAAGGQLSGSLHLIGQIAVRTVMRPRQRKRCNPCRKIDFTGRISCRRGRYELDRRSEEHTSELQSLMRNSYAVFCLKKKNK